MDGNVSQKVLFLYVMVHAVCLPLGLFDGNYLASSFTINHQLSRIPASIYSSTSTSTRSNRLERTALESSSMPKSSFFNDLDVIYTEASAKIKCPFFRRRVADTIDNVAMIMRFLIIRHKSIWSGLDIDIDLDEHMKVPGCKAVGKFIQIDEDGHSVKHKNLSVQRIQQIIVDDWSPSNNKGYYITGRLNSTIYRDDCLFSGPDPDQPVRGLRKYLAAASNLFDSSKSFATLTDVSLVEDDLSDSNAKVIQVRWRMEGVLMLPWRPKIKPWSGWTRYHLDDEGLILHHEEGWDISVLQAFVGTILPEVGDRIWGSNDDGSDVASIPVEGKR